MSGETFTIEIPVNLKDNTGAGARSAQNNLSNVEKAARRVQNQHVGIMARVEDRATAILKGIEATAKRLRQTITIPIRILDHVTGPLRSLMGQITQSLGPLGMIGLGGAGLFGAFETLLMKPLQAANSYTANMLAFQQMMGMQQGSAFVKNLQNWAISTPYHQNAVIGFGRQLLGSGMSANSSLGWLSTLGDTSALLNQGQSGLATMVGAIARMKNEGRIDAGTLDMFVGMGVPIWKVMEDITGNHNMLALRAQVGAGILSADTYLPKIEAALKEKYGGAMGKLQNNSVGGLMNQLSDTFQVGVIQSWGQGIQNGLLPALQKLNEWVGANQPAIEKWSKAIQDAGTTISTSVVGGIQNLGASLVTLVNSPEWAQATTLGDKIKLVWDKVIAQPFGDWWNQSGKTFVDDAAKTIGTSLGSAIGATLATVLGMSLDSKTMTSTGASVGKNFVEGFRDAFNAEFDIGKWINDDIKQRERTFRLFGGIRDAIHSVAASAPAIPPFPSTTAAQQTIALRNQGISPYVGSGIAEGSNRSASSTQRGGNGVMPAPGDIAGWRAVIARQAGPLGSDPAFVNTVLAGAYAESGLNPRAVQQGGGGRGFFQFDLGGMGAGLSQSQLFSESYQASQIIPLYAKYWQMAPAGLSPTERASWVAAMAERPAGYSDPSSAARQRYASAYGTVSGVLGGGGGSVISNQFDYYKSGQLSWADAAAACGPVAAMAFVRATGRTPTLDEAMRLARGLGWNNVDGMQGPSSEVALLEQMGVSARYNAGAGAADVAAALNGGNPVMISTPTHYFVADQYDPQRGFHVGGSGEAMKGGHAWESWDEIVAQGHGVNGDITMDPMRQRGPGGGHTIILQPGAVVVQAPGALSAKDVHSFAESVADPVAGAIARRLSHATANTAH